MSQMCSKCGNAFVDTSGFVLAGPIRGYRTLWFCSLDCLSRWVEAQRPIAAVEERP